MAQNITASLSGTVTDPSGAVVPGAAVLIHNNSTGVTARTLTTNDSGGYDATLLPYGTYTVTIKKAGFKNFVAEGVILHVGDHRVLNAQLTTGAVTQTVTVHSSTTPVQLLTPAQSTTITGTQIRQLMLNNRNFEQLVTLQPGVTSGLPDIVNFGISNTDSISVNGQRGSANNWTVDGSDINDSGSNLTLLNVPSVDAIQEFTVERGNYDAQYGRSGGGQVQVVTKSGTNQFHGDAYKRRVTSVAMGVPAASGTYAVQLYFSTDGFAFNDGSAAICVSDPDGPGGTCASTSNEGATANFTAGDQLDVGVTFTTDGACQEGDGSYGTEEFYRIIGTVSTTSTDILFTMPAGGAEFTAKYHCVPGPL